MKKGFKVTLTKEDILVINRASRRIIDIQERINKPRLNIHKSKKTYSRKGSNTFDNE